MNRGIIWVLSFLLVLSFIPSTLSQSSAEHGLDIARAYSMSNKGFESMTVDLAIVTEDIHGVKTHQQVSLKVSELSSEGSKSMIFLEKSGKEAGNTIWIISRKHAQNEQWKHHIRDFRIKTIKKSHAPFMDTELIFEDFAVMEVEKFTHQLLREEMDDEDHIYVVERKSLEVDSEYGRQIVWYNASKGYRIEKIAFYDLDNEVLKTLKLRNFSKHLGKYWHPESMHLKNHQTGRKTMILFANYKFDTGNEKAQFVPSLARMGVSY